LSIAYTSFLDAAYDTRITSLVPILDAEKKGSYWTELKGALDLRATNSVRKEHATAAIYAESNFIDGMFDAFNADLDNLDRAVSQVIETANSIRNREYRGGAVAVSQRAREVQSGYASLRTLYIEGFSRKRIILDKIVADGGAIRPAILSLGNDFERLSAIAAEQKDVEKQLSLTMDHLKDAFSALRGAAGFKKYPSKWDNDKK